MEYNFTAFRELLHFDFDQEPSEVGEVHVQPAVEHTAYA